MTDPRFNDPITRQELLRRAAVGGAALTLPSILAACGGGDGIGAQTGPGAGTTSVTQELADTLVFANWPAYIDKKGNRRPTLEKFTAATGVEVDYIQEVNDNEEWFGKYQAQLSQGQDIGRDLTVLTDWMAARMWNLGYLQRLNKEELPNVEDNMVSALRSPEFDPERKFSVPWQSGMTGLVVRTDLAPDVTSISDVFDSQYEGQVTMLTEMRDTVPLVMREMGLDPDTVRHHFRRRHGMTFQAYHRARRLGSALGAMKGGDSVGRAAFEAGYDSLSGFQEAFRQQFGVEGLLERFVDARAIEAQRAPVIRQQSDQNRLGEVGVLSQILTNLERFDLADREIDDDAVRVEALGLNTGLEAAGRDCHLERTLQRQLPLEVFDQHLVLAGADRDLLQRARGRRRRRSGRLLPEHRRSGPARQDGPANSGRRFRPSHPAARPLPESRRATRTACSGQRRRRNEGRRAGAPPHP